MMETLYHLNIRVFIHVCTFKSFLYIEEAVPACQITSVCNYHVCKSTVGQVIRAQTTVVRTRALVNHYVWSMCTLAVNPVGTEFFVHVIRAKIEFFAFAVCWTSLCHEDLAISFKNLCVKYHITFRTDTLGKSYS